MTSRRPAWRAIAVAALVAASLTTGALAQTNAADEFRARQEALLAEAQAARAANPQDADAAIWTGRRLGYLGRYNEALEAFTEGEAQFPDDARFPRHAGHRLITLRRFGEAIETLSRAADLVAASPDEVEPDGLPNAAGVPTSTLKGNIYYHLALAHYLAGDFVRAASGFGAAAALAANADSAAASRYWLYLSLARAGDEEGARAALAPVSPAWTIIENNAYFDLALCFKGEASCDALYAEARVGDGIASVTTLYGLAAKRAIDGDAKGARALLQEIAASEEKASFAYIAAEADLAAKRWRQR